MQKLATTDKKKVTATVQKQPKTVDLATFTYLADTFIQSNLGDDDQWPCSRT